MQRFMELAHRLDRETSGVLVMALKRRALIGLHDVMRDGMDRQALPGAGDGPLARIRCST